MKYNVVPQNIYEKLSSLCTPCDIKYISKVLSSIKYDISRKMAWVCCDYFDKKDYDLAEIIFFTMRLMKDIEVFILFKRMSENCVRVNFRSRSVVDVNRIAKYFGGGGHKRASGVSIDGRLVHVEKKVINYIKDFINGKK